MSVGRLNLLFNHEHGSLAANGWDADSSSATVILKLCCPSLLRIDRDGLLQPDLAEAWEVLDNQREFCFLLREGLRFHNGRILDAEAAAACLRRIFDPRIQAPLKADFEGVEIIEAIDARRLRIRFAQPHTAFLHSLAWRCYMVDDVAVQPVGAGPYELLEWLRGSHVRLRRFPGHHDAHRFAPDELVIRFAPRVADRVAALERGEADIVETLPAGPAAELAARGLAVPLAVHSPRKMVVAFRCTTPPFDDPRMRLAVAHALDREAMRARHLGPRGRLLNGVLPEDDPDGVALPPWPLDLDRARTLMREAGYAEGVRVSLSSAALPPTPAVAADIAQQLARIGITLDLHHYDDPPWWPAVYLQGGWQMAIQSASARPHPHIMFQRDLATGGAFNPGGYSNTTLDALIAEARACTDPNRQQALYAEGQRIVHADVAVLPLWASDVMVAVRAGVQGFVPHPLGYVELEDVTC
ncbi:ABC transporter substrate-binding protein [Falsiroseomonas sp.]|uniref:ABC transporter substrate-binding protein n=1 Tax=Falsiroseomonas sp. TaxID=2870721 RepID=UPI0027366BE0|nr:ABC transporter substrate-binding protein [Falsiroseomonas sp.]MDP3416556.1 ABC transporter substrate-binding protein [Falsiroseomonas sp.]